MTSFASKWFSTHHKSYLRQYLSYNLGSDALWKNSRNDWKTNLHIVDFFKENIIGSIIIMRACEFKIDQSFCINILPKGAFFHVFAKFLEITKNLICILQLFMKKNVNDDGGITIY